MSRFLRAEFILPLTIVIAAITLGASEFMTTFQFSSGGDPQEASLAADRHSYALLILAIFAIGATIYALRTGLRSASIAGATFGLAALLLFLLIDLPDAGKAGPLGDDPAIYFADARADPQAGFWLEAIGSVVLGLATVGFATLSSAQLRFPAEAFGSGRRKAAPARGEEVPEVPAPQDKAAGLESDKAAGLGLTRPAAARASAAKAGRPGRARGVAAREDVAASSGRPFLGSGERESPPSRKRSLPSWLRRPRSNGS